MKIRICKDYEEVSKAAAEIVRERLAAHPDTVLGLATGSTPVGMYERLAKMCQEGRISFREAKSFNLDEYVGIAIDHPESYHSFMGRHLFDHVDFAPGASRVPWTNGENPLKDCAEYDGAVSAAGGIDLQILGIGSNGHIAFNEPADDFTEETHVTELNESTIRDNARFFNSIAEVPTSAMTVGMGVIMKAKEILIMATGANKADAVYRMVHGGITPWVPASVLRLHPNVTLLLDEAAASKIDRGQIQS